jgi:hypothetical protein
MSDFGIMQGGPWFYKNHVFEHVPLIFENLIIKTSLGKMQIVFWAA